MKVSLEVKSLATLKSAIHFERLRLLSCWVREWEFLEKNKHVKTLNRSSLAFWAKEIEDLNDAEADLSKSYLLGAARELKSIAAEK